MLQFHDNSININKKTYRKKVSLLVYKVRFWNNLQQVRNNLQQVRNDLQQVRNNLQHVRSYPKYWKATSLGLQ